jgi:hypothetical protein
VNEIIVEFYSFARQFGFHRFTPVRDHTIMPA